jgi:glycosyltransferase involved in cell wall biosynthesis
MAHERGKAKRGTGSAAPTGAAGGGDLSVIVPLFNEASGLPALHKRLLAFARRLGETRGFKVEIVYVDDGSGDDTLAVARSLTADGCDLQIVSLSRNFGKESALAAGLDHARFGALLFMDGDGQHSPELAERLVQLWRDEGYDVVYTAKAHRAGEPATRRIAARFFYRLLNWGTRHPIPEDASDFRLLSPRAAAALRRLPERNRFFKGLSSWIGFRQIRVPYEPARRTHGRTSWNLSTLLGLSIEGLTAFSTAPLRVASLLGLALSAGALLFGVWILFETLYFGRDVAGYPSIIVGIMVIGGVQLLMIGVMGEYIAKILSELKARPVYFVAEHELREAVVTGKSGSATTADEPREAAE